jgi:CRP-like cAMP-binding protein
MAVQLEFLKGVAYFRGLDEAELETIRPFIYEKKAGRGDTIIFEGEPAEVLYFVVAGVVKVYKTSADGKEQIFHIIRPGESFNDVPVGGGGVNLVSAEAMGPVALNAINKADLERLLKEGPALAANVINVLSQRVRELLSLVEDFSFRRVTGRVAKMLLEYASDGSGERPRLTQQEMAAMIGTAREMVGRSLKSLEDGGIIRLERNRIIIADAEALRETAGLER